MIQSILETDLLIIGGGQAALYAAWSAVRMKQRVLLVCRKKAGRSGASVLSMSVHRYPTVDPDDQQIYAKNLLEGGCHINDRAMVARYVSEAAKRMQSFNELPIPMQHQEREVQKGRFERCFTSSLNRKGSELSFTQHCSTRATLSIVDHVRVLKSSRIRIVSVVCSLS